MHASAALETHAVLVGRVEVLFGVEVLHLVLGDALQGVSVHRDVIVVVLATPLYSCAGYEVRVGSQSVSAEILVARTDYSVVVHVDVLHINPCAHAVVLHAHAFLGEHSAVVREYVIHLRLRRGHAGAVLARRQETLVILAAAHNGEIRIAIHLDSCLQPQPQSHLCAVERRLLHYGDGALLVADGSS